MVAEIYYQSTTPKASVQTCIYKTRARSWKEIYRKI